jgi:hypothetical protein
LIIPPVQLPHVLLLDGGGVNDTPEPAFPVVPMGEHLHEFLRVKAIRSGPVLAAIDLDARGMVNRQQRQPSQ